MLCTSKEEYDNFDVSLMKAKKLHGGAYSCKIRANDDNLLVQTGLMKYIGGIKKYIKEKTVNLTTKDEDTVDLLEYIVTDMLTKLDDKVHGLIFSDKTELEKQAMLIPYMKENNDMREINVNSSLKSSGETSTVFYNNEEEQIDIDELDDKQSKGDVICIFHIKNIIFTSSAIKVVIFVTQVLSLEEPEMMTKNLFKLSKKPKVEESKSKVEEQKSKVEEQKPKEDESKAEDVIKMDIQESKNKSVDEGEKKEIESKGEEVKIEISEIEKESNKETKVKTKKDGMEEVNLKIEDESEALELTDHKKVYREIYLNAMKEAKELQEQAIKAYLRAKKINNDYLLDEEMSDMSDMESLIDTDDESYFTTDESDYESDDE